MIYDQVLHDVSTSIQMVNQLTRTLNALSLLYLLFRSDKHFPYILSAEQAEKCLRQLPESLNNCFSIFKSALTKPLAELCDSIAEPGAVISYNEALQPDTFRQKHR